MLILPNAVPPILTTDKNNKRAQQLLGHLNFPPQPGASLVNETSNGLPTSSTPSLIILCPLLPMSAWLHPLATSPPWVQSISSYAIFHPQCHVHGMRTKLTVLAGFQRTQRVSHSPLRSCLDSSASHRMQSICRVSM